MLWSIRGVKVLPLFATAVIALTFGVAAASAPAPAPTFRTALWDSDDSVDVAIADFDGNGRNDIVTANYNPGSVTAGNVEYNVGGLPYLAKPYDLNGDGKPDLVVEAEGDTGDFVSVLLNQGGGRLAAAKDVLDKAGSITVGDINDDGKPDIVSVTAKLSVLVNNGDGTFAEPATYDLPPKPSGAATGKGIVAVTSKGGTLSVFDKDGARVDYPTGPHPSTPAVGDVNGDGEPDIAVASALAGTVEVFIRGRRHDYRAMAGADWVDIRDVNGDGKPDLLLHGADTKAFTVLLNAGDGTFKSARKYPTWRDSLVEAVQDVNGDGRPDVVLMAVYAQVVSVLVNRGDGSFEPKLDYRPALELWSTTVAVGDLAGDKRPELVVPVGSSRNGWTYLSVFVNKPGTCNVQLVGGMTLAAAKRQLARVNCRAGKVRRVFSNWVAKGRVLAQKPMFGSQLRGGTRIDLVLSKGHWR